MNRKTKVMIRRTLHDITFRDGKKPKGTQRYNRVIKVVFRPIEQGIPNPFRRLFRDYANEFLQQTFPNSWVRKDMTWLERQAQRNASHVAMPPSASRLPSFERNPRQFSARPPNSYFDEGEEGRMPSSYLNRDRGFNSLHDRQRHSYSYAAGNTCSNVQYGSYGNGPRVNDRY